MKRMQQIRNLLVDEIFDSGQASDEQAIKNFDRIVSELGEFFKAQSGILNASDEEVNEFLTARGFEVVAINH